MYPRLVVVFLSALMLLSCGENYRVEPMLLDNPGTARKIVEDYSDSKEIKNATMLAKAFSQAVDQGQCAQAWKMLSTRYTNRFQAAAGTEGEARELFCQGYVLEGDALLKGNWAHVIIGRHPHYLTTPPPEMEVQKPSGASLFYVVQKDGSYVPFLVVKESGQKRLEPFM